MTSTTTSETTSARIRARIEELENAVTTTGNNLLAAEQAHRSALRRAVESGDYKSTEATQAACENALAENTRTKDALATAREMLADALRVEAAEARVQAVAELEPLYEAHAAVADRADAAFIELANCLRDMLTASAAVSGHIRRHRLVPPLQPWGRTDHRDVARRYSEVLEKLATEIGGGALHPTQMPNAPAANYARNHTENARREVARGLS